jgi:hypothetical protein
VRLFVALAVVLFATTASAQAPLELEVRAREAAAVDVEALRAALARELGVEVVLAAGRGGDPLRVRVRAIGRRRAVLELRRPDSSRMVRGTELDADPAERLETIVILAVNLVRDESAELLELLRRRRGESTTEPVEIATEAAAPDAPQNELAGPVVAADPTPPLEVAETTTEETPNAPETLAAAAPPGQAAMEAPTVAADDPDTEPVAPADPAGPGQRVLRTGLGAFVGSVPSGGGTEVTVLGGLELVFTPTDFAAIGVRDLGGGAPLGSIGGWSFGGTLFGELGWILDPAVVLHAGLGVDLRVNGLVDRATAGAAPVLFVGARFFLLRELSIAVQTALHAVATDAWSSNLHLLPQGAVLWTGGVGFAFHVS